MEGYDQQSQTPCRRGRTSEVLRLVNLLSLHPLIRSEIERKNFLGT